jgi:hypothetical protein
MKPYGFEGPFDMRKSGGWPRMKRKHCKKGTQSLSEKSMYRWFKRIARRFGKQQTKEQQV